jgi:hypothetical protein
MLANDVPTAKITNWTYELNPGRSYLRIPSSIKDSSFRTFVEQVHTQTGLELASFREHRKIPIVIDAVQTDEPRLHSRYPQPDIGEVPPLRFFAMDTGPFSRGSRNARYGEFTLKGPVVPMQIWLPDSVVKVAQVSRHKRLVGMTWHSLKIIDPMENAVESIEISKLSPKPTHPRDIAYDEVQDCIVVLGWDIVAVDWNTRKSRVLFEKLDTRDWIAFALKKDDSSVIGLQSPNFGNYTTQLVTVDRTGRVVDRMHLGGSFFPGILGEPGDRYSAQLILVGDRAIILVGPRHHERESDIPEPVRYIYVVDLKNGKTNLAWRSR